MIGSFRCEAPLETRVERLMTIRGLSEEDARARMRSGFAVTYADSRWFATYRVHHRVAAQ